MSNTILTPSEIARTERAKKLTMIRECQGLTVHQLAEKVGYTAGMISHLETARNSGSIDLWAKIAKALDVPVDEFIC